MKAVNAPFETVDECPRCGGATDVVKLAGEPAREICTTFCKWGGVTLE